MARLSFLAAVLALSMIGCAGAGSPAVTGAAGPEAPGATPADDELGDPCASSSDGDAEGLGDVPAEDDDDSLDDDDFDDDSFDDDSQDGDDDDSFDDDDFDDDSFEAS